MSRLCGRRLFVGLPVNEDVGVFTNDVVEVVRSPATIELLCSSRPAWVFKVRKDVHIQRRNPIPNSRNLFVNGCWKNSGECGQEAWELL